MDGAKDSGRNLDIGCGSTYNILAPLILKKTLYARLQKWF